MWSFMDFTLHEHKYSLVPSSKSSCSLRDCRHPSRPSGCGVGSRAHSGLCGSLVVCIQTVSCNPRCVPWCAVPCQSVSMCRDLEAEPMLWKCPPACNFLAASRDCGESLCTYMCGRMCYSCLFSYSFPGSFSHPSSFPFSFLVLFSLSPSSADH